MLIKIGIWTLAILGLIFVIVPFFNYAFFDFQCEQKGCSNEICDARTILPEKATTCEWKPEYGCNVGCASRERRCGFDQDFKESCVECVQKCNEKEENARDSCYSECYAED